MQLDGDFYIQILREFEHSSDYIIDLDKVSDKHHHHFLVACDKGHCAPISITGQVSGNSVKNAIRLTSNGHDFLRSTREVKFT